MVDQEIVFDTIKKMKESGLEDDIIISTLQDIGLDESQARELIQKIANGVSPTVLDATRVVAPAAQPTVQFPGAKPQPAAKPATVVQPMPVSQGISVQAPVSPFGMPARPQIQVQSGQVKSVTDDLDNVTSEAIEEAFEGATQNEQANPVPVPRPVSNSNQGMLNQTQQIQTPSKMPIPRATQNQADWQNLMSPEEAIATKAAERVRHQLAGQAEEEAMRHAATQSQLSNQTRQLTEMQSKINKIVKAKPIQMPPGTPPEIKALAKEIEQLKADVSETKALSAATKSLMEKVLDANRKILSRLP